MESIRRKLMERDARSVADVQLPGSRPRARPDLSTSASFVREEHRFRVESSSAPAPRRDDTLSTQRNKHANASTNRADAPPAPVPAQHMGAPTVSTKDWTLSELLKSSNFQAVPRISRHDTAWAAKSEDKERQGIPLIVEDWHTHPEWCAAFDADWLVDKHGDDVLSVRNVGNYKDIDMTLFDFVDYSRTSSTYATEDAPLYAKDVDCPEEWRDWLCSHVIPSDLQPGGSQDLLKHLPPSERVETTMCYYGIGDTFTPCHKDLCGSTGHNLMCHTENGSSFWFMTASDVAPEVAKWFQETLGKELDWENHVTTIDELRDAPFTIYVAEQKVGDLVVIPPRSCHQVVNHGGLTMKLSWSRITVKGMTAALLYELPIYRRVCRPEIYRLKSVLHYSLCYYAVELQEALEQSTLEARRRVRDIATLESLVPLFDGVLREEYGELGDTSSDGGTSRDVSVSSPSCSPSLVNSHTASDKDQLACDYCGADIFQSYFRCDTCCTVSVAGDRTQRDPLVICPTCYVEGRDCRCSNVMTPAQRLKTEDLLVDRNKAVRVLQDLDADSQAPGLTQQEIRDSDDVCIFLAACALRARRIDCLDKTDEERSCRWNHQPSHRVPLLSAIRCHSCHSSTCLMHLLVTGIHASEAFLVLQKASWRADTHWHQLHVKARVGFSHVVYALTGVEKTGVLAPEAAPLKARLALTAQRFKRCRAVNDKFTRPGFYDEEASPREPTDESTHNNQSQVDNTESDCSQLIGRLQMPAPVSLRVRLPARKSKLATKPVMTQSEDPMSVGVDMPCENPTATLDPHVDTPTTRYSPDVSSPPVQQSDRVVVLIPAASYASRQEKRASAATNGRSSKRRRTDTAGPRSGATDNDDLVTQCYGESLVRTLQTAYDLSKRPPKRKRVTLRIDSPESSDSDDPVPRPSQNIENLSRKHPSEKSRLEGNAPRKAHPKTRPPQRASVPTIAASSSRRPDARASSATQLSETSRRTHMRGQRGKPPGRPAFDREACPEEISRGRRYKISASTAHGRDEPHTGNANHAEVISELQSKLRQSEAGRLALENEKSMVEEELKCTQDHLATTRSEGERLKQELQFSLDLGKTAEKNKERVQTLEQRLELMKDDATTKDKFIEDQKKQLEDYQRAFVFLANEFEALLGHQNKTRVDNLDLLFEQLRTFMDGLLSSLIPQAAQQRLVGHIGEHTRYPIGGERGYVASTHHSTRVVARSQGTGRGDQRLGRQGGDPPWTDARPHTRWTADDRMRSTYGIPTTRSEPARRDIGPSVDHASRHRRQHSYFSSASSNPGLERAEVSRGRSQALQARGQSTEYHRPVRPRSPSASRQSRPELPRRGPSMISTRGSPGADNDRSSQGTPVQERGSSTWPRVPASSASEFWEDSYGEDDRAANDNCTTVTFTANRSSSLTSSSNDVNGPEAQNRSNSSLSYISARSGTALRSHSPERF